MSGYLFALTLSCAVVLFLISLMRKRRLREKYAIIWLLLAVIIVVIGAFPGLVMWLSRAVGVEIPLNLMFAVAIVVLLVVCIQLSTEVTAIEEKTRTLVEEVALLRLEVQQLRNQPVECTEPHLLETMLIRTSEEQNL